MSEARAQTVSIDALIRRQKWLMAAAWLATLVPLAIFVVLTARSVRLGSEVGALRDEKIALERQSDALAQQKQALEQQKAALQGQVDLLAKQKAELTSDLQVQKEIRQFANIRIQFYRESDRALVQEALSRQGFKIDSQLGSSRLIEGHVPTTIAYGAEVHAGDTRSIAVALIRAGFPLKRITPSVRQTDPKLIQIVASAVSDRQCGALSETQVLEGLTCGPR